MKATPRKIILLNGPPRSGKDTAAEYLLANIFGSRHLKFAEPLVHAVRAMYGIEKKRWDFLYYKAKDEPVPDLLGLTVREAMISASEDWMKPLHGYDVFGQIAVEKIKKMPKGAVVISDCGFNDEVGPLVEAFGPRSLLIVQISRKGSDFKNDSRGYIDKPVGSKRVKVKNKAGVTEFRLDVLGAAQQWLDGFRT